MKALSIEQLKKIYGNRVVALHGIDLEVEEGDFFALLGPNGAGKSTTIGIVTSLVNKTSGHVRVFGHDLDSEPGLVKSAIGLVPQEFNFSIFEKVIDVVLYQAGYYGIPRKIAKQRAEFYLKKLDLWHKRDQTSMRLSGGMKRRLMIARALVHEPRLLILDEPTAGVDIEVRRSVWGLLNEINRAGTTIILTTHNLEEAENLCKNIAIIDRGQIIEHTSVKSLLKTLTAETFILDLKEALETLPIQGNLSMHLVDRHQLEVKLDKTQTLNDLFDWLGKQGVQVNSMRNKANRLEELFLHLISRNT